MRSEDSEQFRVAIEDLCTAYNRPCTDSVIRVFYESLKPYHILDIKRMAMRHRASSKRFPAPKDLAPERATSAPSKPKEPEPVMSKWAIAANKILLSLAYQDRRRGFKPISKYPPMPAGGYGLPLVLPKPLDDKLAKILAVKADYVRMAEEAERDGEPMDGMEFSDMLREGFGRMLGTIA